MLDHPDASLLQIRLRFGFSHGTAATLRRELAENNYRENYHMFLKSGRPRKQNFLLQGRIKEILERDCSLEVRGVQRRLRRHWHIDVSERTIYRNLQAMKWTRKRLSYVPETRNQLNTLELRQAYASEVQGYRNDNLVFLDESGFNLHTSPRYGWSPCGTRANQSRMQRKFFLHFASMLPKPTTEPGR